MTLKHIERFMSTVLTVSQELQSERILSDWVNSSKGREVRLTHLSESEAPFNGGSLYRCALWEHKGAVYELVGVCYGNSPSDAKAQVASTLKE